MIDEAEQLLQKTTLLPQNIQNRINETESLLNKLSLKGDYSSNEFVSATKSLNKERSLLEDVTALNKALSRYKDAHKLLVDSDMAELAQLEVDETTVLIEKYVREIKIKTAKPLDNDDKRAIIEIRPGVGGVEASLFAEDLFRMYIRYCNTKNYRVEQYSVDYDSAGGIKEAVFLVDSPDSFGVFRFESGVHRVQRVPKTESAGRIHTSTASVVVMPKFEIKDVQIKDDELRIDVYRASGPGGQSVNTTDSAVRITHIPTGITVTCQNGKSQHKNKEMALGILISKLQQIEDEKRSSQEKNLRESSIMGGDRSAKIRTYNFPQGRITDHRVHNTWYSIETALEGEIDEIVTFVNTEIRNSIER